MKKLLTFCFLIGFGVAVMGQSLAPASEFYRAEKVVKATYFEKMKALRDTEPITPGER